MENNCEICGGNERIPIIILDNGKIYWTYTEKTDEGIKIDDEIRDKFGLNYRFELFEDCVDNLWSNKSIKEFSEGEAKEQSLKNLFNQIKDKNKELMYYPDKRIHSFIACDIISNYFYPLFNCKGRTYFQADFGSGKSRQSLIYQKLSFNSLFASNISPASFERVIESTGGTIIVDNFDNISEELKPQILQIIEVYYKKGGKNIKADGVKHRPIAYNGYSPLLINNIVGLPEVTESRCNRIQLLKTSKKEVVDKKINDNDPFWSETKDNLHILALQQWRKIKEVYETLEVLELSARDLERAEAILTIAKSIGEDIYKEILEFILETNEQQSIRELTDNWEFIIYEFLNEVSKDKIEVQLKVKEITESLKERIIQSDKTAKSDKLKFSHYTGKILRSVPTFKKKIIDGWVHYQIKRADLDKMLVIKGFDKYLKLPHLTSLNNTNNTNNTNYTLKGSEVSEVSEVRCGQKVTGKSEKDNTYTEDFE